MVRVGDSTRKLNLAIRANNYRIRLPLRPDSANCNSSVGTTIDSIIGPSGSTVGRDRVRRNRTRRFFEVPHLRLCVSYLRLRAFTRVLVDVARDRDIRLSIGDRLHLKSNYFPLKTGWTVFLRK